MDEKRKETPPLNRSLFLALWVLTYALAWGGAAFVSLENYTRRWLSIDNDWEPLLFAIPLALIIGGTQSWLARRTFGLHLQRWIAATAAGWLVSGGLLVWMLNSVTIFPAPQVIFGLYYLFPTLAQWWILRKHVSSAWLWILAGLASSLVFILPFAMDASVWTVALGGALQGSVTALALQWLAQLPKDNSLKAKQAAARLDHAHGHLTTDESATQSGTEYAAFSSYQENKQ